MHIYIYTLYILSMDPKRWLTIRWDLAQLCPAALCGANACGADPRAVRLRMDETRR